MRGVSYLLTFFLKAKHVNEFKWASNIKLWLCYFCLLDRMSIIYSNGPPSVQSQKHDLVDCVLNKEATKSTWSDTPGHASRILLALSFPQRAEKHAGVVAVFHVWVVQYLLKPYCSSQTLLFVYYCTLVLMYKAHNMKWLEIAQDSLYQKSLKLKSLSQTFKSQKVTGWLKD